MTRIPDAELERLKAEVSVERLVEASGITLARSGKDRLGKCPFHEDREASLVVTPDKNLFHCFGCGAAGGPIDWVMKLQGLSFRAAVDHLRADQSLPSPPRPSPPPGPDQWPWMRTTRPCCARWWPTTTRPSRPLPKRWTT